MPRPERTSKAQGAVPGEVLEGVVERVSYVNEESAWSVIRLEVPRRRGLVTVVGNLLGVQPGESLRVTGEWTVDRRYGEQFHAAGYVPVRPATLVGLERYLGSGLVRGVGRVMAKRLVERFGLATLEVIEGSPERLREVEGIGRIRSARIAAAWVEQQQIRDVMVFLQGHGVSTAYAVRIYKEYRERSVAIVRQNPYRLAIDISGIGFRTADKIARELGISAEAPERAQAAVLHLLGERSGDGHVLYPRASLVEETRALLEVEVAIVERALESLAESGDVVVEIDRGGLEVVYLRSLHRAESGLAALLTRLAKTQVRPISIDVERALEWLEKRQAIALALEQREAIRRAISSKVLVVTGGPGTGKTTLMNGIIQILERKGRRILLCAPTGRAAKRMSEATGREARTLHRTLEFEPKRARFARNREHPLDADMVIVDEASMIDTVLAYDLAKALPLSCQLVLIGDVDQLPSVGPGSVLQDVIRSGLSDVVRLVHVFRQAEASPIVMNAHRVNRGDMPVLAAWGGAAGDFAFVEHEEAEGALAAIKSLARDELPRARGLHPTADVQVLTPMHRGLLGAANLNRELQSLLNPEGRAIVRGNREFRVGDKVMQIRNNYDLEVYNGDIGHVHAVDEEERTVAVRFDGRVVDYEAIDLDDLVLGYACSIHKAQGSEYPCVVLALHTQHHVMLQRNLFYTAITRARSLVVVVGSRRAVARAVANDRVEARFTRLAERLRAPSD